MRFALAGAAALVVFLSCPASEAQETWFPGKEGASWTYSRTSKTDAAGVSVETGSNVVTGTFKGKETVDGQACLVVEWSESAADDVERNQFAAKMWIKSDADSLAVVKTSHGAWLPPADFKNKKSKTVVKTDGNDVTCETTVGGEETVTTPVGKFTCVKVSQDVSTLAARTVKTTVKENAWYAKGVGLVKLTRTTETPGSKVIDELVLKKLEKGKDAEPEKKPDDAKTDDKKPASDEKDILFPVKEGATFTYLHKNVTEAAGFVRSKDKETVTCACKAKEKLGDLDWWSLEWDGGEGSKFNTKMLVRADENGVAVRRMSGRDTWVLPADLKKKTSTTKVDAQNGETTITSTVGDEEDVETPAGKFKAVKVTGDVVGTGVTVKRTCWYAKGVGPVKMSAVVEAGGAKVQDDLVLVKRGG